MNNREQALLGFKKAHSHLGKVIKMVESGSYCIDVMQQNLAVIGLLKGAHAKMMENHLNSCFLQAMSSKNTAEKQKMIEEILRVSKLANK